MKMTKHPAAWWRRMHSPDPSPSWVTPAIAVALATGLALGMPFAVARWLPGAHLSPAQWAWPAGLALGLAAGAAYWMPRRSRRQPPAPERTAGNLPLLERSYRSMVDHVPAGIVLIDARTHEILFANRHALRLFGRTATDTCGHLCHEHICPNCVGDCPISDRGQPIDNSECTLITATGEQMPILKTVVPITIHSRRIFLETFQDISDIVAADLETRRLNQRLQKATIEAKKLAASAQAASVAKTTFLTNMSHEIRTPLNGILGLADLLADAPLTGEQREALAMIQKCGASTLELFSQILDYAQIERGCLVIRRERLDLHALIERTLARVRPLAAEKGLRLGCELGDTLPDAVVGDGLRLGQVLTNLLTNAVKFTAEGSVTLQAEETTRFGGQASVRFGVRDTGIGIDEYHQECVFDPFYQVDASTTREAGGTGLGLAISRDLVDLMGGTLKLQSHPGKGTLIWFTLAFPLSKEGAGEDPAAGPGLCAGARDPQEPGSGSRPAA